MSKWMHLELDFKNRSEVDLKLTVDAIPLSRPTGIYRELICYFQKLIDECEGLINRYFFLFEPNPHVFLALELKDTTDINAIKEKIDKIEKPNFIGASKIKEDSKDDGHDEPTIDFFHASAKFAFYRIGNKYDPQNLGNNEFHIIHCFCNLLFVNPINEILFCSVCSQGRAGVILNEYKEIVSQLNKKTENQDML